MQKIFYRKSKKEINKIIHKRCSYNSLITIPFLAIAVFSSVFVGIFDGWIAFLVLSAISLMLFVFLHPEFTVSDHYFTYRVMDWIKIIDNEEFLFSYKMYKKSNEIMVRRDDVLKIQFTDSISDRHCFESSSSTYEKTRKMSRAFGTNDPGLEAKRMKLELVKFVKPKKYGYIEEITEYIIPEFFEEQDELMEALHKLADNFEKRKQAQFDE